MPTSPAISTLAAVTQADPGPTTRSIGARPSVGQPVREGGDRLDAARDEQRVDVEQAGRAEQDRVDVPVTSAGDATTIVSTPATRAGTTPMTSELG